MELAKARGRDVVLFDTAGRLAIDDELMGELDDIKTLVKPENTLLVVDAMIGQDAVRTAKSFDERIGISGFIMTKLDGDAAAARPSPSKQSQEDPSNCGYG